MSSEWYGVKFAAEPTSSTLTRIASDSSDCTTTPSALHQNLPIQSKFRGCVVKDGVVQYYLDPTNWNKAADPGVVANGGITAGSGVTAPPYYTGTVHLDGTDGDVCVHTPKFYITAGTDSSGNNIVVMSEQAITPSDATITSGQCNEVKEMFIDAYRGTVDNTLPDANKKLVSVNSTFKNYRGGNAGTSTTYDSYLSTEKARCLLNKPKTGVARAVFRNYAKNAGKTLLTYDQYKNIFVWPYVIEYNNLNSQADYNSNLDTNGYHQGGMGTGVLGGFSWNDWGGYNGDNPLTPCGFGDSIGNGTGCVPLSTSAFTYGTSNTSVTAKTYQVPRWRGFDNPFGDIWTNLDGIILDYTDVYILNDSSKYSDTLATVKTYATTDGTLARLLTDMSPSSGSISSVKVSKYGDIYPTKVNGKNQFGDYFYNVSAKSTNGSACLVGGIVHDGSGGGLFFLYASYGVGYAYAAVGARGVRVVA